MIRFTPARRRRGFGSSPGGEPCPTIQTLRIPPLPGGGGFRALGISGCPGSPFRAGGVGARLRAIPALAGTTGRGLAALPGRALRRRRAQGKGSGSARAIVLASPVLLLRAAATSLSTGHRKGPISHPAMRGRRSARCGSCTGWRRRGTCARPARGWGCRGSRPMCCGGGTLSLRSGGMRRWCWRGGMSRRCWRCGRSTGWRRLFSITASRWRCGGALMRGCCSRIWRGSTGRRRRRRRGRMPTGSTKCWRWWRARCRRSWCCSAARRRARVCRRSGRAMWPSWARRWRRPSARPGSMR